MAKISIVVLLVIVARSAAEVFRLLYVHGEALTIPMVMPFVTGALIASLAAIIVSVCCFAGRHKVAIAVTLATVACLFTYKLFLVG